MFEEIRERYFPLELTTGIEARSVSADIARNVREALLDQIFPNSPAYYSGQVPEDRQSKSEVLREVYMRVHREWFIFYDGDQPIGWSLGRMQDAVTYRMGNSGIIPEYRRKGIYTTFAKHLLAYLKEVGYERVNSHHHPTNTAIITAKMRLGFVISGLTLREDAGPTTELTYFFYPERRQAFHDVLSISRYD